jgi:large subunit ribosomal protein L31
MNRGNAPMPRYVAGSGTLVGQLMLAAVTDAVPVHAIARTLADQPAEQATRRPREPGEAMKSGIHPEYVDTTVICSCGNTFKTRSTAKDGVIHADVCASCHPFYTGKQKILDTGGRVARFERRFGKKTADSK